MPWVSPSRGSLVVAETESSKLFSLSLIIFFIRDDLPAPEGAANIINFPLAGAGKKESNLASTGGSNSPSDYLPNIPSSDFNNTSIAISESLYNVV